MMKPTMMNMMTDEKRNTPFHNSNAHLSLKNEMHPEHNSKPNSHFIKLHIKGGIQIIKMEI